MARLTASTADLTPITVSIDISGIGLSQLEAQKLASSIQSSLQYQLGVEEERLVVSISADVAEPVASAGSAREAFAAQAVAAMKAEMERA